MTTAWTRFTAWSWQLPSCEHLSFTPAPVPSVVAPLLSRQVASSLELSLHFTALLCSLEHLSSSCCYSLLPSFTIRNHSAMCHPPPHPIVRPTDHLTSLRDWRQLFMCLTPSSIVPSIHILDIISAWALTLVVYLFAFWNLIWLV